MKKKVLIIFWACFLCLFGWPAAGAGQASAAEKHPVIALCHPTADQIQNIAEMYEKEVLSFAEINLLCVYHEDEEDCYDPAKEYVSENKLDWVKFQPVHGQMAQADLFRENAWTAQFREIFSASDGIIFTGGEDLPPGLYGQETSLLSEPVTPRRSLYEISFLFHLLGGSQNQNFIPFLESRKDYPVLAICLGAQTLNVACGGSLIQDIPSQVYGLKTAEQVLQLEPDMIHSITYGKKMIERSKYKLPHFHRLRLEPNSIFARQMAIPLAEKPLVISSHHQAIDKLGRDLTISATSLDSRIVEAVEHRRYAHVLAIQFHPEPFLLYRRGVLFPGGPGAGKEAGIRSFRAKYPPSYTFHLRLWQWFASCL